MGLDSGYFSAYAGKSIVLCTLYCYRSRAMYVNYKKKQLLDEKEYRDMREKYEDDFKAGMGAEAIQDLLKEIDLEKISCRT